MKESFAKFRLNAIRLLGGAAGRVFGLAIACLVTTFAPSPLQAQNLSLVPVITAYSAGGTGIAIDSAGNLFIADVANDQILKVTAGAGATTVVAGTPGKQGFSGDGGPATSALLALPYGVAVDSADNIYIADQGNRRIRMVSAATGIITTVAGTGMYGYTGDGGLAINAELWGPQDVAVDSAGNFYFSDTDNFVIRKVTVATGIITTVAGRGACTPPGDGGPATSACLGVPYGLAFDSAGNMYIADAGGAPTAGGNRIREVSAATGIITTVAGTGNFGYTGDGGPATSAELCSPHGMSIDSAGNIYIADTCNDVIRMVSASTGIITTIVGNGHGAGTANGGNSGNNGPASSAELNGPFGVVLDNAGNLYVEDSGNGVVRKVSLNQNLGNANVCPGGSGTIAPCYQSSVLAYYVSATTTFSDSNPVAAVTQGASGLDFSAGTTCFDMVQAGTTCLVPVTFFPTAPGLRQGAVQLYDTNGNILVNTPIYGNGVGPAVTFPPGVQTGLGSGLAIPSGIAVDAAGDVFIAENGSDAIVEIPAGCTGSTCLKPVDSFNDPLGNLAIDGSGTLFVISNGTVFRIPAIYFNDAEGELPIANVSNSASALAIDGLGDLFIADTGNNQVLEFPASCPFYGCSNTVGTGLTSPAGVAVDAAGDVFISDLSNGGEVVEVPAVCPTGSCQNSILTGLGNPGAIALDAAGDIYVTETSSAVASVSSISASRTSNIVPVGGSGGQVLEIPAGCTSASSIPCTTRVGTGLVHPAGIALDASGDVFIADSALTQAVEVNLSQPPTLTFPSTNVGSSSNQTFFIQNIGNQPLTAVSPGIAFSGGSFSLGTGGANACSSSFSLAPGASCTVTVTFSPVGGGPITGSLVLTDNALNTSPNATQTIPLSGTGVGPLQSQSITVTAPAPASILETNSFTVAASASSGQPVTYTSSGACTNSGSTYTVAGTTGTCMVIFDQSGGNGYSAAPTVTEMVMVVAPVQVSTAYSSLTAAPNPALTGAIVNLTATLNDASGNLINVNGATVTFGQTLVGGSPSNTANFPNGNVATTVGGVATVTLTDPYPETLSLSAAVSGASVGTLTDATPLQFVQPNFVVTTLVDPTAANENAAHCTQQASTTIGTDAACSLREAVDAANALTGTTANINFASSLTTSATTANPAVILINQPTPITMSQSMNINGPGPNLLTIEGGIAPYNGTTQTSNVQVFDMTAGNSSISGVTVANGYFAKTNSNFIFGGGGLYASGSATLSNCSFIGNVGENVNGGAVNADGGASSLTVNNCTFTNNQAPSGAGGAISAYVLTVNESTFSENKSDTNPNDGPGGAIFSSGSVTVSNSTFYGNQGPAIDFGFGESGSVINSIFDNNAVPNHISILGPIFAGALISTNNLFSSGDSCFDCQESNDISIAAPANLSPLGYYGGPTQTLLPLPGSAAICAGTPSSVTTDQRGLPTDPVCSAGAVDIGAVQTNYALNGPLTVPSVVTANSNVTPAPSVTITESGTPLTAGAATVTLTDTDNDLSSGATATSSTTTHPGVASFSGLQFSAVESSDALTATLTLNPALATGSTPATAPLNLTVNSATFAVTQGAAPVLSFIPSPSSQTYGTAIAAGSLDASASYNSQPVTGTFAYTTTINGVANSPVTASTVLPAGTYIITATFTPSNTALYSSGLTTTASYKVTPAPLTVSIIGTPTRNYDGTTTATLASSNYQVGGLVNPDAVSVTQTAGTYAAATAGSEAVTATLTAANFTAGGTTNLGDYSLPGSATGPGLIKQATTAITTLPTASAITYGQALSASVLSNGAGSTSGSFSWTTSTITPNAGTPSESVTFTPNDTKDYTTATGQVTVKVNQASQTITFSTIATQTVGTPLTLGATASSGLAVSYSALPSTVCSVSGSTASFVGSGSCTITASQTGSGNYSSATPVNQTFTVNGKPQTITFGTIATQTVGTPLTLGATASSGLAVSYSASPSTVCSVSGSTATFVGSGSCTITASQTGNSTYSAATSVSQIFTVKSATSTQSFTLSFASPSVTIPSGGVGATDVVTVVDAGGFTGSVALSATLPTLSSSEFTDAFLPATTTTNSTFVIVAQPGVVPGQYIIPIKGVSGSLNATTNLTVNVTGTQTITFATIPTQTVGTPLTLGATASSGLTVSYSASPAAVCTVSGTTATFIGAGTCTITASQSGNTYYSAATSVSQSFTVKSNQSFTLSLASPSVTIPAGGTGGTDLITVVDVNGFNGAVTLSATLPSGFSDAFLPSSTSATTSNFILAVGATVTPGQYTIPIKGVSGSLSATVNLTVNVTGTQTIAFGTIAAQTVGTPLTLGATASSGLAVSYAASPAAVCTVSGATVTFVGSGTCTIIASQPGNTYYSPATSVSQSFTVNGKPQTITFGTIAAQTVGTPLTLGATASSGLAVTYAATPATVCAVSGSTATFVGAGSCTITASQAGNSTYAAAAPVIQNFTVKGIPSFTLAAASSSLSQVPGAAIGVTDVITVKAVNGFNGTVNFTETGIPAGVDYTFLPASSTTSTTLVIYVPAGVAASTNKIVITGTSGTTTAQTTVTLTIQGVTKSN